MSLFLAAGCVVGTSDGRVILITESRGVKAGRLNLPVGGVESGESLRDCAVREVLEETGIRVRLRATLGVYQSIVGRDDHVILVLFAADAAVATDATSEEHGHPSLFSIAEVELLSRQGRLRSPVVLRAVHDFVAGRRLPLSAVSTLHLPRTPEITIRSAA
ncbi:MAG: NUDIX domain-containing protein [Chloroflexota bacterium]